MGVRAHKHEGTTRRVEAAVRARLATAGAAPVVLAVSGGRDSMALLQAATRVLPRDRIVVATFDHGTGAAASRAAALVADAGARLGVPVVVGHAATAAASEAGWRAARYAFLDEVAFSWGRGDRRARVVTAHTRDDQVETVLMRILRGAGARGLAGLYAASPVERPLLDVSRADVEVYACRAGLRWVDDPINASPAYLRNRVRHDLLPALRRVATDIDAQLLALARRAARLRRRVDRWAATRAAVDEDGARVVIPATALDGQSAASLALLWPAVAARAGLAMDRRGTLRAAAFTTGGRVGASMPMSGGWRITRSRDGFELHRARGVAAECALKPGLRWSHWHFAATNAASAASDEWVACLGPGELRVRAWRPGDRIRAGGVERRVKRFLSDARISGELRAHWPVVLEGTEIVWIPGVRRSDAAAVRPGRPGVHFRCDYDRR